MRFRKIALAVVACLALTAVAASAAQPATWKVAGAGFAGNKAIIVSSPGGFTLTSKVLGAEVVLKATGVECSGTCNIVGGTSEATGALKLTKVTFTNPSTCSVTGGSITTAAMRANVIMDPSGGEATFLEFVPASGTTFFELPISGATCPLAGNTVKLKGSFVGRSDKTGVEVAEQPLVFSAAEQATGGGSLTIGAEPATLTGTMTAKLTAGGVYGASEAPPATWKVAGAGFTGNKAITVSSPAGFTLTSKILGAEIVMKATGAECAIAGTCNIVGGTSEATGALKLTGVTFTTPSTCSVTGGSITTAAMKANVIMDPSGGEATFLEFVPASGTTFFELPISGATCPLAGNTVKFKGSFTARSNKTGVEVAEQPLVFSAAEQATGGGSFTVGAEAATLTGTMIAKLTAGGVYGAS